MCVQRQGSPQDNRILKQTIKPNRLHSALYTRNPVSGFDLNSLGSVHKVRNVAKMLPKEHQSKLPH